MLKNTIINFKSKILYLCRYVIKPIFYLHHFVPGKLDYKWEDSNSDRIIILNKIADKIKANRYLEIGCDLNQVFNKINCENKVGVDPSRGGTIKDTSDNFFKTNKEKFDLIFIDGLHTYDQILKDFKNSFNCLKEANKLKKEKTQYSISKDEKIFNNIIKTFSEIDINNYKKTLTNKQIIFICGMPRSGTTLFEQIIASHNQVSGAGELVYLQNVIKNNFFQELNLDKQKIIEEALAQKNTLAEKYLHLLNAHNYKTEIITDKTPPNFMWIGFIKIFFPNSKIIHCSRDARDNCLSLFKNNFASRDMEWAHDQNDIAQYYNLYLKLINFWKLKSPDSIYEANYESIVNNPEKETRKLLKFCNLEWDDNCLNFYKNKKTPIQTVSVSQARKPIYNSSVNSNSDYSKYLQDMYNILDTQ